MQMPPERLDIQLRRARLRRQAQQSAWIGGVVGAIGLIGMRWVGLGWRWSYLLFLPLVVVIALWIGRLTAEMEEEATRWFWRPPR